MASGLLLAVAARATDPTGGAVFELPKLTVEGAPEYPPPEDWLHAEVPGFDVLSSLPARETARLLADYQLLRLALDVVLPGFQPPVAGRPSVLILCGRGADFRRFLPTDRTDDAYRTDHLLLERGGRRALIVNAAIARLDLAADGAAPAAVNAPIAEEAATGLDTGLDLEIGATVETNAYRAFRRAYFRQVVRRHSGETLLPWLEEGLVQLCAAIEYRSDLIVFGKVGGGDGRAGSFNTILRQRSLMPMAEFLAHDGAGSDAGWSAQAYAFVHYCLFGGDAGRREAFHRFIGEAARGPVTEETVRTCFGLDYRELGRELRAHVDFTAYRHTEFRAGKGGGLPRPRPVAVVDAPAAKAAVLVGETLALAGRGAEARLVLQAAVVRGGSEPRLLASLGRELLAAGDSVRGARLLEQAVAGRVDRAEAYLLLARQRQAALPAAPATGWPGPELQPLIGLLETACRQAPPEAEVFTLLADLWLRCADGPSRESLGLVNAGVLRFPREPGLIVRAAELNRRHGDPAEAREIIRHGLAVFTQPTVRAALEAIARRLPPP